MPDLNTTLGGGRFVLQRKLGVGGMGSVFDALDQKRHVHVALKSLGQIDPITVSSFKAEFRDFQHLHHPNLVVLDEFFSEGNEWHFTMELLNGQDFLSHVRHAVGPASKKTPTPENLPTEMASDADLAGESPRGPGRVRVYPGSVDIPALRETMRQLTAGLAHLHSAGKVHRDVKSSNVIITTEGRAVLLDFGVSVDVKGKGVQLAGTPLYMAPELFWHSATPAADWYSVGVLLYQALTGMDPWQGGGISGLVTTKRPPPVHPSEIDFSVPEELGDLCVSLLEANPKNRAGRRAILEWLEYSRERESDSESLSDLDDDPEAEVFIGRQSELRVLETCYEDLSRQTGPVVVFIQGESGIGKSALVHEFTANVARKEAVTVLRGRVLEEELVPYKSVDGIVDSLGEYFLDAGYEKVKPLLPEHFNIVADVFPVLRRSAAVAELPRTTIPDPTERRLLMFAALKECLKRLGERQPLILEVDDLQWSDADSMQLWNDLVRAPNAPKMLLLATVRLERTGSIRPSKRPPSIIPSSVATGAPSLPTPTRTLWLARLSSTESMAYVEARLGQSQGGLAPEEVVEEASGHPLFIDELLRYRGPNLRGGELTLEYVLSERIGRLDADQRKYLELVCVSAKPLARGMFAKAAGLTHGAGLRAFKALRAARLIRTGRTSGPDGDDWVASFHYRVRNACLQDCSDDDVSGLHRAVASTMENEAWLDPEHLAIEWREAGDSKKASQYAETAANAAFAALAFRKAAEFYSDALGGVAPQDTQALLRLRERLARSLRNAGNGKEAADIFLQIAANAALETAFAYKCEAVELLLRSGYVDEALTWANALLNEVGESMPATNPRALAELVYWRARIFAMRRRWTPSSTGQYVPAEVRKVDALWSVCFGLGSVAQLPSFALFARYVQRALKLGEPMRVARAFATEAMIAANTRAEDVPALIAQARAAADLVPEAPVPLVWSVTAMTSVMTGSWPEALQAARVAQARIAAECAGSVGEWAMAAEAELWGLAATGNLGELYDAAQAMRARASTTRDLYATMAASSGLPNLGWIAHDEPERAIQVTAEITARWSQKALHIQHLFDAYARAQAMLYLGDEAAARQCFDEFDRRAKGTLLPVPKMMVVFRLDLEARIELALQFAKGSASDTKRAEALIKKLLGTKAKWAAAVAALLGVGVTHLRGDRGAAVRAALAAERLLADVGMEAHRIAAAAYRNELGSGSAGPEVEALRNLGVVNPERYLELLVPGLGQLRK